MKTLIPAVATLGLLAGAPSIAQEDVTKFRAGVGLSSVTHDENIDGIGIKAKGTGWEIFGGYQFNPYFGLEVGYMDGGKADDKVLGVKIEAETSALALSAIGRMPLSDAFALYGRLGVLSWEADLLATDGFDTLTWDADGTDLYWGIGGEMSFGRTLIRAEYRQADLDGVDMSMVGAQFAWKF